MKVYKDPEHCVTPQPFQWRGAHYFMLTVGQYFTLEPAKGTVQLRSEQDFWKEVPQVFASLGQAPVIDQNLPKLGGEVLLAGCCRTPRGVLAQAQEVSFSVGNITRRMAVFGDRQWLLGGGTSEPVPFTAMPLIWGRAFGGANYAENPYGIGLDAKGKHTTFLPNVEDPAQLLLSKGDTPSPTCPLPMDMSFAVRRALSGTYDDVWQKNRWPALPDDCNPDFFYGAQKSQRLEKGSFFTGGEDITIIGMHHDYPRIQATLPPTHIRAFVLTTEQFMPFSPQGDTANGKKNLPYAKNLDEKGIFREILLQCDTIWLFPDILGVFVLRRGLLPVVDDEMDDILRVLVVTEQEAQRGASLESYREVLQQRAYSPIEIDTAPLVEAQAKTTKVIKTARDLPKVLAKIKQGFFQQMPSIPASLGDITHASHKTIARNYALLDKLEKQMLEQREHFSHVMSFDMSQLDNIRKSLAEQEKHVQKALDAARDSLVATAQENKNIAELLRARLATMPANATDAEKQALLIKLEWLDNFTPDGVLYSMERITPWHDRGIRALTVAYRTLQRYDTIFDALESCGLEEQSVLDNFLGFAPTAVKDVPEHWGLPADAEFTLPAGLYVPHFDGKTLVGLAVYPWEYEEKGQSVAQLHGLGAECSAIVRVPGSSKKVLSLPAAYPDGAILIATEELSAIFAEQECGDFCHIVAAHDPAMLANIEDLPPILNADANTSASEDTQNTEDTVKGVPLVVLLPPKPDGAALFAPWAAAYPSAIPLYLPEQCPHVLALAAHKYRLRRLVLDCLPVQIAAVHDFDIPIPPKNRPPEAFTLNMPLPTKEEMQSRIDALVAEIKQHIPDMAVLLAEKEAEILQEVQNSFSGAALQNATNKIKAAFAKVRTAPSSTKPSATQNIHDALQDLKEIKQEILQITALDKQKELLAKIDSTVKQVCDLQEQAASLDALHAENLKKVDDLQKGELPDNIKAAFAEGGMHENTLKHFTREYVEAVLADSKDLQYANLQGLDLSGLDFSNAQLAHAICTNTSFARCRMAGADFTFTLAKNADFSHAVLHGAKFKNTVLQNAVLQGADFSHAYMELVTLGQCTCNDALFTGVTLKLCNFSGASFAHTCFSNTRMELCNFTEIAAPNVDFSTIHAFKCLFQKSNLREAHFDNATLHECLLSGVDASACTFINTDVRKLYTDDNCNLADADFSGADLRDASWRMTHATNIEFYGANLQNVLMTHCDLTGSHLDGLQAEGCRFIKCDLTEVDLSGTNLHGGSLYKSRINDADITNSNLFAADVRHMVVNAGTHLHGSNVKKTLLEGKIEDLHHAARNYS